MKRGLKRLAARMPRRWQQELKRRYFGRQIRITPSVRMRLNLNCSPRWFLRETGRWISARTSGITQALRVGGRAWVGDLSRAVPERFELLAANVALIPHRNVTLINAAASDSSGVCGMQIPKLEDSGLDNFYTAHLSAEPSSVTVLRIAMDSFTPLSRSASSRSMPKSTSCLRCGE